MKVLFMPLPGVGHTFPMVPLAWAMRTAGHDVTFLGGFDGLQVSNAGFPVVDGIPPGTRIEDLFPDVLEEAPDIFESMAHLTTEQILGLKPMVVKPWDIHVDSFVAAARQIGPDLIFFDPVFSAGLVAAAVLDVPAVGHGYMLVRFTPEFVREHAAEGFERHGVDLPKRRALIDLGPASLMEPGPATWQMRYVPYNGGGVLPAWLAEPPARPRVAVTLGTPLPHRTSTERLAKVVRAAAQVDADFALTVGEATAEKLGPLPDNVRTTGWIPLFQLLQTCTAVIHHGGSGTMFTASAAGIPQLVLPEGADNDYNARRLRAYGCALVPTPGSIEADDIRALLSSVELRTAARNLRQEMEQMPTPAALVEDIVEFARS
jgi:UDP:flavonoid glycosyltransferase YjiC (YdhE family)